MPLQFYGGAVENSEFRCRNIAIHNMLFVDRAGNLLKVISGAPERDDGHNFNNFEQVAVEDVLSV
jgi:hypothetical protein